MENNTRRPYNTIKNKHRTTTIDRYKGTNRFFIHRNIYFESISCTTDRSPGVRGLYRYSRGSQMIP